MACTIDKGFNGHSVPGWALQLPCRKRRRAAQYSQCPYVQHVVHLQVAKHIRPEFVACRPSGAFSQRQHDMNAEAVEAGRFHKTRARRGWAAFLLKPLAPKKERLCKQWSRVKSNNQVFLGNRGRPKVASSTMVQGKQEVESSLHSANPQLR